MLNQTMERTIILLLGFAFFQVYAHPAENVVSSAAVATASPEPKAIAGTRMRVDWQGLISGHNLELPRLPGNHTESLRLGNGGVDATRLRSDVPSGDRQSGRPRDGS